ncbi:MAG: SpoIIE family protein phosphatase, partial [Thermoleophilaceae bacterium]|nr:SpoIIE family protein phosphatase [Thermoleophilaceae bacterium]
MTQREGSAVFGRSGRARALGYLFIAGGVVAGLTLLLPHDDAVRDGPIFALVVIAAVVGVTVLVKAESVPDWALHAAVASGTLILSAANYFVGTTASYPFLYSWVALYAFACFAIRPALAHMAFIAASYTVVLALQTPTSSVTRWLLAMGTPLITGILISQLLGRLRNEATLAKDRARIAGESEERTRAIVQGAPDAFVTVDEAGKVLSWNREAGRLFGVPAAEALGRPVSHLMFRTPEARANSDDRRRALLERLEEGAIGRYEAEMARADGSCFPAELTVSRVPGGEAGVLAAFVRDLSERLQRRAEREQLLREQAARAEAEQMAGMVRGLQVLLDTALAHRDLDSLLAALLPRVCEVFDAEAGTIALADEEGSLLVHSSTAPRDTEGPVRIGLGEPVAGLVAQSGEPLLLQDPDPDLPKDPALKGMGSILSVPLKARGVVTGVIQVGVPAPRRFSEDDLLLLGLAADRVAISMENVRVFEREHRIAETLQSSLMPDRLPRLPGLEAAARYRPAASEAEVGGDFYDVIPMEAGRVGLVMGDVAGKGLAAASVVGRLRNAMRAYAHEGHDPPTAVGHMNQLMWSEAEDTQMATLIFLVVDGADGSVCWASAGHLPPLLVSSGAARLLQGAGGVPLGVMPYATYEQGSAQLDPGDTVLLYTDGLVERPGEIIDDGLARLAAAAHEATGGLERLCDELLAALVPSGGAVDDVALLAVRSPVVEERLELTLAADPSELASMRALLRRWLARAEGTENDVAEILAATGEAAANAIEHGSHAKGGQWELTGLLDGREVDITVRDHGSW